MPGVAMAGSVSPDELRALADAIASEPGLAVRNSAIMQYARAALLQHWRAQLQHAGTPCLSRKSALFCSTSEGEVDAYLACAAKQSIERSRRRCPVHTNCCRQQRGGLVLAGAHLSSSGILGQARTRWSAGREAGGCDVDDLGGVLPAGGAPCASIHTLRGEGHQGLLFACL